MPSPSSNAIGIERGDRLPLVPLLLGCGLISEDQSNVNMRDVSAVACRARGAEMLLLGPCVRG
jgi:hypothetical protein